MTTIEFAEAIRRDLSERGQSKYRAALNSGLPQDAIRLVLKRHIPRLNRVEQLCRALGLELYIGLPRDVPVEADGAETSGPLTRLSPSVELPVRVISQPALKAAVAEHLEESASSLNRRIKSWPEQGVARRSEMQNLLQQVEGVKQLA